MKKETHELLKRRAMAMAVEHEEKIPDSGILGIIAFSLASETYGVESGLVREVYPLKDFTPLPGVPSYILGIVNVRGQILPVVDLKKFFNLPEHGLGELNKIIILCNDQMEFGILADVVIGTQTVAIEEIHAIPSDFPGIGEKYLRGMTKEGLIILDADKILSDKGIVVNDGNGM
jgi:purine-binding chemotaxis protein CheW